MKPSDVLDYDIIIVFIVTVDEALDYTANFSLLPEFEQQRMISK